MKPATDLIHHGDGVSHEAEPLTTPIYETTTFLFRNAEEVRAYNEGKSAKYLYSRYAKPTVAPVEQKIAALEGAEAALVVSNTAAAVMLAISALARRRAVVIARSQLVEIGGGFRVPDVMKQSGARLLEVGTTNRTRIAVTYAINDQLEPAVFAIMTQGYPYLVRVNSAVLSVDEENEFTNGEPVINRVRMANERPFIPDLEEIEKKLIEVMPERHTASVA